MKELDCFRYLSLDLSSDGEMEAKWMHRLVEGRRVAGALKKVRKKRPVTIQAKMGM